jgi:hypothetical protein
MAVEGIWGGSRIKRKFKTVFKKYAVISFANACKTLYVHLIYIYKGLKKDESTCEFSKQLY